MSLEYCKAAFISYLSTPSGNHLSTLFTSALVLRPLPFSSTVCMCVCVCVCVCRFEAWVLSCFSCLQLFVTLWAIVHQDSLSMGFSKQKYWSGLTPGRLPNPGIEPMSLKPPPLAGSLFTTSATCVCWQFNFFLLNWFAWLWVYPFKFMFRAAD